MKPRTWPVWDESLSGTYAQMLCQACGKPVAVKLHSRQHHPLDSAPLCNRPDCVSDRERRRAEAEAIAKRDEKLDRFAPPVSEGVERYGSTTDEETFEGLKTSAVQDGTPAAVDDGAKRVAPSSPVERSKQPRYLKSVPTPIVPTGDPEAPYGRDDENRPIQPLKTDQQRHSDTIIKSLTEDRPRENVRSRPGLDRLEPTPYAPASRPSVPARPLEKPILPPTVDEVRVSMVENATKFFGIGEAPESNRLPEYYVPPDSLTAQIGRQLEEEQSRNGRQKQFSLRKVFWPNDDQAGREQIAAWLDILELACHSPKVITIFNRRWVGPPPAAERIAELRKREKELVIGIGNRRQAHKDLSAKRYPEYTEKVRRGFKREIAVDIKKDEKALHAIRQEIHALQKDKSDPKNAFPQPGYFENIPGTGRELCPFPREPFFAPDDVRCYKEAAVLARSSRGWTDFENKVIKRAAQIVFCPLKAVIKDYPTLAPSIHAEGNHYMNPDEAAAFEAQLIKKTGGDHISGHVVSAGYDYSSKTGRWVRRSIESFDGTRGRQPSPGAGSDGGGNPWTGDVDSGDYNPGAE